MIWIFTEIRKTGKGEDLVGNVKISVWGMLSVRCLVDIQSEQSTVSLKHLGKIWV